MNKKIMIAPLYSYEPIIAGVMKLGASKLYLFVDNNPSDEQKKAVTEVVKKLENVVSIQVIPSEVYDLYDVSKKCIEIIDSQDGKTEIILNVSGARKTKAFAFLLSGYARSEKVDQIVYITKETADVIQLPILSIKLTPYQKSLLSLIDKQGKVPIIQLIGEVGGSRAKAYRHIQQLKKKGVHREKHNGFNACGKNRPAMNIWLLKHLSRKKQTVQSYGVLISPSYIIVVGA